MGINIPCLHMCHEHAKVYNILPGAQESFRACYGLGFLLRVKKHHLAITCKISGFTCMSKLLISETASQTSNLHHIELLSRPLRCMAG